MRCPECNCELPDNSTKCNVCGWELSDSNRVDWKTLGCVHGKAFADLARETLESAKIPAVVISKSGFFGNVGLPLNPLFNSRQSCQFEISVPVVYCDEALDILVATLGDKWEKQRNN
ncbi:MAG: hypothetical protein U9R56_04230 [candidate division Zixibacteria bacterium]|nr:hypothetical protein [candidate division Zixibacteria bacterium]